MTTDPRFCVACHAPIPPGREVCATCDAYQYAASVKTPRPSLQYSEPIQPPTGVGINAALQAAPGQYILNIPVVISLLPLRSRTSGFAITSLVLGIVTGLLTMIDLLFGADAALDPYGPPVSKLPLMVIPALFCWTPALLAFIFGLRAQSNIQRDHGQTQGLGLAYAGITLGAIGLALPLVVILLFSLSFFP